MRLLVVRHGIAMEREEFQLDARKKAKEKGVDPEIFANDELRPLTGDGVRRMRKNAQSLAKLVTEPDLLVTSPLVRAIQTAEVLQAAWVHLEAASIDELKPERASADFLSWLNAQKLKPDATVVIVGHEPHLSSLVSWFLGGTSRPMIELKKGGACLVEFKAGVDKGRGRLSWLATPKMLR
ncbi:MAG: histidine phosphatase family protein [Bdellovibrionota bacterium]